MIESPYTPPARPVPTRILEPAGPGVNEPETQPQWWRRHWKPLVIAGAVVVLAGGGALAWNLLKPKPQNPAVAVKTPSPSPSPAPTPTKKASPLTGALLEPALANRPVVSVIVENHPEARPQSGLADAGVVYEALAEGGITRFQTFFLEGQPKSIGPVRSLRPYFVDWGLEYNAPIAHAGGSATALNSIGPLGVKSLNALAIGAPSFYRTTNRYAPHNLYTSSALLDNLLANRKYNQPASFAATPRKADTRPAAAPHPNITINYSSGGYQAKYTYDAAQNDYARTLAGSPHKDANTGQQIHVKNVVVEYMVTSTLPDTHMQMTTLGRGNAVLFRDGQAIACTWVKDARTSRTKLVDAAGAEIPLNVGNTWYSIVPVGKTVSY